MKQEPGHQVKGGNAQGGLTVFPACQCVRSWRRVAKTGGGGATTKQLMAIYGWSDPKMAEIYVKKADQKRLAGNARKLLARSDVRKPKK